MMSNPLSIPAGMLCDWEIKAYCETQPHKMVAPFSPNLVREANGQKIISYGLTSFGYDVRLGTKFSVFRVNPMVNNGVIDPKSFDQSCLDMFDGDYCVIPPNSYALGVTMEKFRMPEDVVGVCLGKSTYARIGLIVNVTPLEPGWVGWLTLELGNSTPLPIKVHAGEGIAQIQFFKGRRPSVTYADRAGKYQNQIAEPVSAKV